MNLLKLKEILKNNQNKNVNFYINNKQIPIHYHLTEVGSEIRTFIDCGGTKRKTEKCVLQLWVANDVEHRLTSDKFLKILGYSDDLFINHLVPDVYVEYEKETVSQYPIISFESDNNQISFYLDKTHTQCLAPEKCGVSCCSTNQEVFSIKLKNS